jgi:hypothetical protein
MPSERPGQTLADYVAVVISPALIMAMVSSLVFFLLEVLYVGQYSGRLQWILFFFVFGAVLIARVSMRDDIGSRAGLYGLVLGGLTYLGMQAFVEYPAGSPAEPVRWAINLVLVGLVWWSEHRLTWDCTYLDEDTEVEAQGLLQAAGLEERGAQSAERGAREEKEGKGKDQLVGWWERWQRYREEKKKKRTMGVWIVYFALAALPLFGLGQALIPAGEVGRRQYAFWLMGLYLASSLGLLLTTNFLGLRRYLRQRKLQMPRAMVGVWLTLGGGLVLALLLAGALLPRPESEYSLINFTPAGTKERDASNLAFKGDSPGKGEGRASNEASANEKDDGSGSGNAAGEKGAKGGKDKGGGNSGQGKDKGKGGSQQGKDKSGGDSKGKSGNDQGNSKGKGNDNAAAKKNDNGNQENNGSSRESEQKLNTDKGARSGQGGSSAPRVSTSGLTKVLGSLGPILKWIVFAALAVAVLVFVLRGGLRYLANFTQWARDLLNALRRLWESLFGWGVRPEEEILVEDPGGGPPPRPFTAYRNPFADGSSERRSPRELLQYSFAALQAWAWEHDLGRQTGETPLEFADRLGGEIPPLETAVRRLAALYARATYGKEGVPGNTVDVVRQFWQRLEQTAEQPLSA